jgi:DNA-binding response OmpR family regulator
VLHHTLKNISVLIVDNEQKIAQLVKDVMGKLGFSNSLMTIALDGFAALETLKSRTFDLIICDWEMLPNDEYMTRTEHAFNRLQWGNISPNNGANFVRCLRWSKISPYPFIPVLMLTGPTTPNHIYYARDAGVSEILFKPINAVDLVKRIISMVEEPRDFITCDNYKGPCRRRINVPLPPGMPERRHRTVKIIRYEHS